MSIPPCRLIYKPGDDDGDGLVTSGALLVGESRAPAPRFRPRPIESRLRRDAIEAALRQTLKRKWARRIVGSDGTCRDPDVLALFGLEDSRPHADMTVAELERALALQLQRLQRARKPGPSVLARNIGTLADLIGLDRDEQAILRIATLFSPEADLFRDLFRQVARRLPERLAFFADAAGVSPARTQRLLAEGRMLRLCGVFEDVAFDDGDSRQLPCTVSPRWMKLLTAPRLDANRLLRHLLRCPPAATLGLADFAHIAQVPVVLAYLRTALARRRRGVNVLIHGAPGTGKTQFARACAAALDAQLFEVPNEDSEGDPISGVRRFGAFSTCQRILAHGRRQILLFDEVEDVFGSVAQVNASELLAGLMRQGPESLRKSWINETLESNPTPALWACNSVEAMDPAFVRRFDLVVEFRAPPRAVRRRLIDRYFRAGDISDACAERLADLPELAPAQVERAARVTRALRSGDRAQRDAQVEGIVQSSLQAMGLRGSLPAPVLPGHYDLGFLNADTDLPALARSLRQGVSARLCLYGPPGTGKTAFAHHLGRTLDMPVHVRRASDLLSCFVGATEQRIREMFAQARDDGAIVVLDEADGFPRDRSGAQRSFEVTQVNELLTQMEAFDGVFVASTNLMGTLDAAALRRFDFKIRFDWLRREQRRALLARVCGTAVEAIPASVLAHLDRLDHLTPGDFANVLRQLRTTGQQPDPQTFVQRLAAEAAVKPEGRHRAIGFSASP